MHRSTLALAVLLLAAPAAAEGLRMPAEDVTLVAGPEVEIERRAARDCLREARRAFVLAANGLSAPSRDLFRAGRALPFWIPETRRRTERIAVELREEVSAEERSYEAILGRLAGGDARILLAKPAGEPDPELLHELAGGMARAAVAHGLGPGAPIWFREGVAAALGEEASEGGAAATAALRERLEGLGDDLDVKAVLLATDPEAFRAAAGPAAGWAVVRLLRTCRPEIVPSLHNQSRILLEYVAEEPPEGAAIREFTHLMFAELEAAGASPEVLGAAIREWVAAGFPEGSDFRKTDAWRTLKRLDLPDRYGIAMKGRFGLPRWDEAEEETWQPVKKTELAWRLPWRTGMEVTAVLSNRPDFRFSDLGRRPAGAIVESLGTFSADPKGTETLRGTIVRHRRPGYRHGAIFLCARSPAGLVYVRRLRQRIGR